MRKISILSFLAIALVVLPVHLLSQTEKKAAAEKKSADGTWKPIFNGKDLNGWKHVGPGEDSVEDGLIRTHGGMGLLYWTGGKVSNSRLKVVYKMRDKNDNSGVFIRIPVEPREEWMPVHYGYEMQIHNHPQTPNQDD